MRETRMVPGAISQADINRAYNETKIGDKVKIFVTDSYQLRNIGGQSVTGTVVDKYTHHVSVKIGRYRESFLWVDLVMQKLKREGLYETA